MVEADPLHQLQITRQINIGGNNTQTISEYLI